jgi:alpha-ketoglutarate-dependent 2,4-dichlorophenoxyacetate dioxygenase
MSIEVIPTGAALGAEIRGVDLTDLKGAAAAHPEIESALNHFGVVFFRGQYLPIEAQESFIRQFGPANKLTANVNTDRLENPYFFDVSNVGNDGELMKLGDDRRHYLLANLLWHSDMSMRQPPARITALWASVLPEVDAPDTEFVDTRTGYELLSDEQQALVEDLMVEHSVAASREKVGFTNFTDEWRKKLPPNQHRLVRIHNDGRKSLYIGAHASHIVGWPIEKGKRLLEDLLEVTTQPRLIYRHKWQLHDLLVWNNACTMHRARRFDDQMYRRELRWCSSQELEPV